MFLMYLTHNIHTYVHIYALKFKIYDMKYMPFSISVLYTHNTTFKFLSPYCCIQSSWFSFVLVLSQN